MKPLPLILAATFLPTVLSASEPPTTPMPPAQSMPSTPAEMASKHVMYDAAQLKWGDAPPALERGAQAVVLSGDPKSSGPFVIRLKTPPGYKVAMHWHPTDEQVTVIEGDLTLQMDGHGPGEHAHTFGPGGFALLPAQMHHSASTKGGTTVQLNGMGPFEVNYVDPKDDPRLRAPAK